MKCAVFVLVAALAAVVLAEDHYTTKYDNVDIDAILSNDRLLGNYIKCLLDQGKCTEDGQTLKDVIPDALKTECAKCNEHQKESVKKVAKHLYNKRKEDWDTLVSKYDPDGKYRESFKKYEEEIKA